MSWIDRDNGTWVDGERCETCGRRVYVARNSVRCSGCGEPKCICPSSKELVTA